LFSRATNRCPLIEVWLPSPISFLLSKGYMKDKKTTPCGMVLKVE
jgi:hypothetical protein